MSDELSELPEFVRDALAAYVRHASDLESDGWVFELPCVECGVERHRECKLVGEPLVDAGVGLVHEARLEPWVHGSWNLFLVPCAFCHARAGECCVEYEQHCEYCHWVALYAGWDLGACERCGKAPTMRVRVGVSGVVHGARGRTVKALMPISASRLVRVYDRACKVECGAGQGEACFMVQGVREGEWKHMPHLVRLRPTGEAVGRVVVERTLRQLNRVEASQVEEAGPE